MKKHHPPVIVVTVLLFVVALAGYLTPPAHSEIPYKILLKNRGGNVVFNHHGHDTAGVQCVQCHHASKVSTTEVPCGRCHPAKFDQKFVHEHIHWFEGKAACATCHHLEWDKPVFDHPLHEEVTASCQDCHHDESIEPRPTKCRYCHKEQGENGMPILRDAVHTRCRTCHEELYEEELSGCSNCHSRKNMRDVNMDNPTKCRECHDKPHAELIPPRKQAFHDQCMGCHQKNGKGPYRDTEEVKDCGQCHLPRR